MKKIWEIYGIKFAIINQAAIFGGYYPNCDRWEMAEQVIAEGVIADNDFDSR